MRSIEEVQARIEENRQAQENGRGVVLARSPGFGVWEGQSLRLPPSRPARNRKYSSVNTLVNVAAT